MTKLQLGSGFFRGLPALSLTLLFSCGGGGSGGTSTVNGVFVDSPVEGMDYFDGTTAGVTGPGGTFSAPSGARVEFMVGNLSLGSATAAARMTPVTLVSGATDETDQEVVDIARVLQSLDTDGDPTNGIVLTQAVRDAGALLAEGSQLSEIAVLDTDASIDSLLTAAGATVLIPEADARAHLRNTLLGGQAGLYRGTFSGGTSGNFSVFIDRRGSLIGCAVSVDDDEEDDPTTLDGTIASDGTGVFGNTSEGATFSGDVADGRIAGTWDSIPESISGNFSGNLVGGFEPFLDESLLAGFAGTYTGTFDVAAGTPDAASGTFTLAVLTDGHVTVTVSDGSPVSAAVESVDTASASVLALSDFGSVIQIRLATDGSLTGTLRDDHNGETGTLVGTKS